MMEADSLTKILNSKKVCVIGEEPNRTFEKMKPIGQYIRIDNIYFRYRST